MNKSILFAVLLFISICFLNVAHGKEVNCKALAAVKCGFGKSDEATLCRSNYQENCETRYNLILKCSNQISGKCISYKKGSLEYKRCERSVAASECVSLLTQPELNNCRCKKFSQAICGSCPSPSGVQCRSNAFDACKKQCGANEPCKNKKKRICVSPPKCNCKTLATHTCALSTDSQSCYKTEFNACNKRCIAATRCYPVNCKNAGHKRCASAVATVCEKYSNDLKKYEKCIFSSTKRCHSFELANCKKARRLFKFRAECDYNAKDQCENLTGDKLSTCETQIRKKCIEEKILLRKKYIRHSTTCSKRAKLLCDAKENCKDLKACYAEETAHCIKRKHRRQYIVPPECVARVIDFCGTKQGECYKENIGKCTEIWLRRYCERKAYKSCDADVECMQVQTKQCKQRLPKCWRNRDLCNDNNKCTIDVCDPNVGCLHIPKTCNDNNACTKDVCDAKVGCTHTAITCDDAVPCTIDSCNVANGQCEHKPDNTLCTTNDRCTIAFCTKHGCKFQKDATCKRTPPTCDKCTASSPCQVAQCEVQDDATVKCTVTNKNCDDGKKCTTDSCDASSGECVHKQIVNTQECPANTPMCQENLDCTAWAISQDLNCKCSVAVCDASLGICKAVPTSSQTCVTCEKCSQSCKPRDACDGQTTSCSKDKSGNIICNRPAVSCDDSSPCTKDSCDINSGKCVHEFVKSNVCLEQCETDADCIKWAITSELDQVCQSAVCDKENKNCVIFDLTDQTNCPNKQPKTPVCPKCTAANACETAECFYDSENNAACRRTINKCDDSNPCTVDSCDTTTGKCVYTFVESKVCQKCAIDSDCTAFGKSLNLAPICKTAVCDKKRNICRVSNLKTCPIPPPPKCTVQNCSPANKCETAKCVYDSQGNPTCARSNKVCNDNDVCTTDACDLTSGKCTYTPVQSSQCTTCNVDNDCQSWGVAHKLSTNCREAYCNKNGKCRSRVSQDQSKCKTPKVCVDCLPLTPCDQAKCVYGDDGTPTCQHSQINCDDSNKCTEDYCDISSGKCVHNNINSKDCHGCNTDSDCADWGKNLASTCQEAYCANHFCQSRVAPTNAKCAAVPVCPDCESTLCSTATCVFGADNQPVCVYSAKNCDDGNKCTTDKCDAATGNCVSTFFQSSQCISCLTTTDCTQYGIDQQLSSNCKVPFCNTDYGYCDSQAAPDQSTCQKQSKCSADSDCNDYATKNNLAAQCLAPYCNKGSCSSKPINDLSKCVPPVCKTCTANSPCETVSCDLSPNGYICNRKPKDCNDNNDCTADSCDSTGKCVHTTVYSDKCVTCSTSQDCAKWAVQQKLTNCQQAQCDTTLNLCIAQNVADKTCVPQYFCDQQCPPKDKCHRSRCHYNANQQVVCDSQTLLDCNDQNDCTTDSCDTTKGCVNVFTASAKCVKCTKNTDCAAYALANNLNSLCLVGTCDTDGQCVSSPNPNPACVPNDICTKSCSTADKCQTYGCQYDANKKVQCTYVTNTCNDGKDCTDDSCDSKTGLCLHVQRSDCGPNCKTTLDCAQWGIDQKLSQNCKQPFCDQTQGSCVSVDVTDITKCPVHNCKHVCPNTKCQTFTCAYDKNKKVICSPQDIDCNDNNECTVDSCDINTGCVHKFVKSPTCHQCSQKTDAACTEWASTLGDCFTVSCDLTQKKCVSQAVNSPTCNKLPPPPCPVDCKATNLCETATLVKNAVSCTCQITKTNCDDGISCTTDSCDLTTGKCLNTFQYNTPPCTVPCKADGQCGKWALDNKLYDKCHVAACDTTQGTCVVKDDTKTNCKKCHLDCKPNSNCDTAKCVWVANSYQCEHSTKNCDDGKTCTTDSCDTSGNCVHTWNCPGLTPCSTDVDCSAWGQANQLSSQCLKPVCNQGQGSCQSVPDTGCTHICKQNSDCPPSQFGSVCNTNTDTCEFNTCQFDADCLTQNSSPDTWNYCQVCNPQDGKKCCVPKKICHRNPDCDDSNPCTTDVCLKEYGFCRNLPLCNDNNECTLDLATPSADGKTCSCSNPPISCTTDATLLNQNFVLLSNEDKAKWLGKCDKNKGCVSCVVNAQCDDHNGCSTYSCQQQYCISVPINNAWCDPKKADQPITYQSIPGLRTALELAGYDIDKLVN